MNSAPLLTIAIPTYNRANCLKLLLESIAIQLPNISQHNIEVLIFDNCSIDDTMEVSQAFAIKNSAFQYIRNNENIGADMNFVKAFLSARGKYLWMLGDDELLLDGSIQWVMNFCWKYNFGCLYLSVIPETLSQLPLFLGQSVRFPVKIKEYGAYEFVKAVNYGITFLSASVVNREKLLEFNPKIYQDIDNYSKSNLVHLTWVFSAVLSMPLSYFAVTPILAGAIANSSGYRPVKVFIVNFSEIFEKYFYKYDLSSKQFIRLVTLIGWFPKVVFDLRFSQKYWATDFAVDAHEFPMEMRSGLVWWVFSRMIMRGSKFRCFFGVVFLKLLSKLRQSAYLFQGRKITVGAQFDEK